MCVNDIVYKYCPQRQGNTARCAETIPLFRGIEIRSFSVEKEARKNFFKFFIFVVDFVRVPG